MVSTVGAFSIFSILSYNVMGEWTLGGNNFNDTMDYFSNQILLPLGGLFIAIFAGWFLSQEASRDELALGAKAYGLWRFLIRYVVPPAVLIIFVMGVSE